MANKNINLCEEGCDYLGENLTAFQLICYYPVKTDMNKKTNYTS